MRAPVGNRSLVAVTVLALHAMALSLFWSLERRVAAASDRPGLTVSLIEARPPAPASPPQPRAADARLPRWQSAPQALPLSLPAPAAGLAEAPSPALPIEAGGGATVATAGAPAASTATPQPPSLEPARRAACAPAPHPPLLRERGIEGVVRLRVWVDELGRAGEVLLAASSGFRLFDDAALLQVRRCPFHPARRGNELLGSWVEFPVRFVLNKESQDG